MFGITSTYSEDGGPVDAAKGGGWVAGHFGHGKWYNMYICLKQVGMILTLRVKSSLAFLFCFSFDPTFREICNIHQKGRFFCIASRFSEASRTCIRPSSILARSRSKSEKMFGARAKPKIATKIPRVPSILRYFPTGGLFGGLLVEAERIAREIESGQMLGQRSSAWCIMSSGYVWYLLVILLVK